MSPSIRWCCTVWCKMKARPPPLSLSSFLCSTLKHWNCTSKILARKTHYLFDSSLQLHYPMGCFSHLSVVWRRHGWLLREQTHIAQATYDHSIQVHRPKHVGKLHQPVQEYHLSDVMFRHITVWHTEQTVRGTRNWKIGKMIGKTESYPAYLRFMRL